MERAATVDETMTIANLLRESMEAGAFGFSTTNAGQHVGFQGRPLACRLASHDELRAYGNVLKELGRGAIEIALTNEVSRVDQSERELLDLLLTASGRPVTWLALLNRDDDPDAVQNTLEGGRRSQPAWWFTAGYLPPVYYSNRSTHTFYFLPTWIAGTRCSIARPRNQMTILGETGFRAAFKEALKRPLIFTARWEVMTVLQTTDPDLARYVGRNVAEIAAERGADPVDTFLDLAIEDQLRMQFNYELFNSDESRIPELITDPRIIIGLSDGGAHVDALCDAGYCTYLLGTWVRDNEVLTLERAVQRITTEPASLFGITQRGAYRSRLSGGFRYLRSLDHWLGQDRHHA